MAIAPLRTMLSTAREEAVVITSELAATARASTAQVAEAGVKASTGAGKLATEMNPIGVRHAIEMSVKEGGESSILHDLTNSKSPLPISTTTSTSTTLTTTLHELPNPSTSIRQTLTTIESSSTSVAHESTMVAKALERDLAITFREAAGNATQTGIEEQLEEAAEFAKVLSKQAEARPMAAEVGQAV